MSASKGVMGRHSRVPTFLRPLQVFREREGEKEEVRKLLSGFIRTEYTVCRGMRPPKYWTWKGGRAEVESCSNWIDGRRLHGKPELLLPTLFGFRVAPSFLLKPYRDQKFKPMIFDQLLESLTMVETDIDKLILIQ